MYENLLYQNETSLLREAIKKDSLPGAILFSGPEASGKLTCALETSRILSCKNSPKGKWDCTCSACLQHKALLSSNTILLGPRDCTLEIAAAKKTFLFAVANNEHVEATRYLFIRSIRKLTMRFNPILWEDSDKLSKISSYTSKIDELLEEIDPPRELPELDKLTKICDSLENEACDLENDLMYGAIPILQVRNLSSWARISLSEGKKVIIIERAERMSEGVRNALLKILEEPPENTVFILTTEKRNAVMPTILSRVRTYNFTQRTLEQSKSLIERVYHDNFSGSIEQYLQLFLPVTPEKIYQCADSFYVEILNGTIPDINALIKECNKFDPKIIFRLFLEHIFVLQKGALKINAGTKASALTSRAILDTWNNVSVYNQSILSSLENLVKEIAVINKSNDFILTKTYGK